MDNLESTLQSILNSPESMDAISSIAKSMTGEKSEDSSADSQSNDMLSILNQVDPKTISAISGVIREYNSTDDRRYTLLNALRPYLQGDATGHIDKALQIMRLSKVIKHVFSSGIGGGTNV